MNDRMRQLAWEAKDALALRKWCSYAKALDAYAPDWHEDWYYTEEQGKFFDQYERQLDPLYDGLCILAGAVCGAGSSE